MSMTNEIATIIRKYYADETLTYKECEEHFESHCSIWLTLDELIEDLEQDLDYKLVPEHVKNVDEVTQLSDGSWLAVF